MEKLDELRMELVEVRQAIDMAETVLEFKEDAKIRQQLMTLESKKPC